MRGAGELLGTKQSGHIAVVGFHLYTRMLAAAVSQVRKAGGFEVPGAGFMESTKEGIKLTSLDLLQPMALPVNVDLPLDIGIPESYVSDMNLRLRLYRRLADISDQAALEALKEELIDRFGSLPEMTINLFSLVQVKLLAEAAGLASVSMENGQIVLRYPPPPEGIKTRNLPDLAPDVRAGKNAYWCQFGRNEDWQSRLLETLAGLKS
jgi:transcription-repair coupling factor (superfamily II helicase)